MTYKLAPFAPPRRLLMGPGPSDVAPEVLAAMSHPVIGHLDPAFLMIMDETMEALRHIFRTRNRMTLPMSGAGSLGMETAAQNLLEPGDRIVVGVCGVFGARLADMSRRTGAEVDVVEAEWGRPVDPEALDRALSKAPVKALAIVHVETSTGVMQKLEDIVALTRKHGCLLVVDAVASLGGMSLDVDGFGIDVCYSGSQKCLSAPPGLSPITLSERAVAAIRARKTPVRSWYVDLVQLDKYWGGDRVYHHTAPVSMVYALREALRMVLDEGLDARIARHLAAHRSLAAGLPGVGLEFFTEERHRPPVINAVRIPTGLDARSEKALRRRLLDEEGIEIAGGLGPMAGKIWRIGLMGHSARTENVERLLAALRRLLGR